MDLYELLASSPNKDTLRSRVDTLCKGRSFGDSLTPSMLYCILEALENGNDDDFMTDVAAIKEEIRIMEDSRSINERKRAYGIHLLMEKTKLPLPAKMLIATGFLQEAPQAASRSAPSKYTLTEEYLDATGAVWTYAPYTAEAWRGCFH